MQTSSSVPVNRPLPSSIDSSHLRCGERAGTAAFPGSSARPLRCVDEALTQSTKRQLEEPKKVNKNAIDPAPSTLYVDFPFRPSGARPRLQQRHQQQRRRVRFASPHLHDERHHIALADMTDGEVLACWYDEVDLEDLQMDAVATVRALRRLRAEPKPANSLVAQLRHRGERGGGGRELERGGMLSSRGLEHLVDPELLERRRAVRDGVARAVLIEQEALRILAEERGRCGVVPGAEESIARASADVSLASAELAILAALEDASAAREIIVAGEKSRRNGRSKENDGRKRLVDALLRATF